MRKGRVRSSFGRRPISGVQVEVHTRWRKDLVRLNETRRRDTFDWRFRVTEEQIAVHMLLSREDGECFKAGMTLALEPASRRTLSWMPFKFPLVTLKVVAGIYWQALKLWIKGIPFHPHPNSRENPS